MTLRCRPRRWRAQDFAPYSRSNPAPPGLVFAPDTQGSRIGAGLATKRAVQRHPQEDTALMAQKFTLNVNGSDHTVEVDPDMPLLYALRNDIGLNNPHFGCGLAQCGACTVHLDGQAIRSCVTPVSAVGTGKVVTLAGLGTPEKPHPLQTAYVEEQVPQCGYCINGWIMTAAAFLRDKKKPTDAEIKTALEGLKCRCGTHMGIMRAVKRASEMMG
jgi:nicotinate dehydrogenase subunit A